MNVLVDGGYLGRVSGDGALDSAVPLHCTTVMFGLLSVGDEM